MLSKLPAWRKGGGGGWFIFSMSIVFRSRGLRVFHGTFFLEGGGCLKAPRSEGMDGWVTGGVHHWGGGLFPVKMFDVGHRQGRGRGGSNVVHNQGVWGRGSWLGNGGP